jgi:hypothetical protein
LPCVEDDSAVGLTAFAIGKLAAVEELLARVSKVVEEAGCDGGEQDKEPGRARVDFDELALADDGADEAVGSGVSVALVTKCPEGRTRGER